MHVDAFHTRLAVKDAHGNAHCCRLELHGIPPGLTVPCWRALAVSYAQGFGVGFDVRKLQAFWEAIVGIGLGPMTVTMTLPDDYGTPLRL